MTKEQTIKMLERRIRDFTLNKSAFGDDKIAKAQKRLIELRK